MWAEIERTVLIFIIFTRPHILISITTVWDVNVTAILFYITKFYGRTDSTTGDRIFYRFFPPRGNFRTMNREDSVRPVRKQPSYLFIWCLMFKRSIGPVLKSLYFANDAGHSKFRDLLLISTLAIRHLEQRVCLMSFIDYQYRSRTIRFTSCFTWVFFIYKPLKHTLQSFVFYPNIAQ